MDGILWSGKSKIDNKPIVAILTGSKNKSRNKKLGKMQQVWILRKDINALDALKTGQDYSICGNCPNRGDGSGKKRSCYVSVFRAPNKISNKLLLNGYGKAKVNEKLPLRIGAYGDPGLIPINKIKEITSKSKKWTGYTHLWNSLPAEYSKYLMASVSNEDDANKAIRNGWRVFLSLPEGKDPPSKMINCPASKESGYKKKCEDCMMCNGGRGPNIWIKAHGIGKKYMK